MRSSWILPTLEICCAALGNQAIISLQHLSPLEGTSLVLLVCIYVSGTAASSVEWGTALDPDRVGNVTSCPSPLSHTFFPSFTFSALPDLFLLPHTWHVFDRHTREERRGNLDSSLKGKPRTVCPSCIPDISSHLLSLPCVFSQQSLYYTLGKGPVRSLTWEAVSSRHAASWSDPLPPAFFWEVLHPEMNVDLVCQLAQSSIIHFFPATSSPPCLILSGEWICPCFTYIWPISQAGSLSCSMEWSIIHPSFYIREVRILSPEATGTYSGQPGNPTVSCSPYAPRPPENIISQSDLLISPIKRGGDAFLCTFCALLLLFQDLFHLTWVWEKRRTPFHSVIKNNHIRETTTVRSNSLTACHHAASFLPHRAGPLVVPTRRFPACTFLCVWSFRSSLTSPNLLNPEQCNPHLFEGKGDSPTQLHIRPEKKSNKRKKKNSALQSTLNAVDHPGLRLWWCSQW